MPPVFPSGAWRTGTPLRGYPSHRCAAGPFRSFLADGYTCPQAPDGSLKGKHVIPGQWFCHRDRPQRHLRGHMQNLDLNGRSDGDHILQLQRTRMPWTAFPHTRTNTKKSLQTISRLKTLSKHGGFLLSHLVWQYHRR